MAIDPVVEAARLRRERRRVWRVLRISGPVAVIGIAALVFGGESLSPRMLNWLVLSVVVVFFVSFVAISLLIGITSRDIANRFRPGSARAYEDE